MRHDYTSRVEMICLACDAGEHKACITERCTYGVQLQCVCVTCARRRGTDEKPTIEPGASGNG